MRATDVPIQGTSVALILLYTMELPAFNNFFYSSLLPQSQRVRGFFAVFFDGLTLYYPLQTFTIQSRGYHSSSTSVPLCPSLSVQRYGHRRLG